MLEISRFRNSFKALQIGLSGHSLRRLLTAGFLWGKLFYLQLELFCLQLSSFAYSPLRPLLDALSHCKQKAPTVSKEAKTVSKKAPTASKKPKLPTVSKKAPL